jgi:hypothetical protein
LWILSILNGSNHFSKLSLDYVKSDPLIHEPKRRLISAAPFRDRVVHHALCNCIEPLFERSFIHDSYANRLGKGTHRALDRCQQFARHYPYVLACDVRQFFPSLDHAVLRRTLWRKVKDGRVRWLIDQILAGGAHVLGDEYEMVWFPGDDLLAAARRRGLPIGNLTSQFWANCYLNPFDHFVKRELRCPAYLRYVDDLRLFAADKDQLWQWRARIEARLARYRLTIHPGSQPQPVGEGVPFLGFVIYPDRRRLKRRQGIHEKKPGCHGHSLGRNGFFLGRSPDLWSGFFTFAAASGDWSPPTPTGRSIWIN